MSKGNRVAMDFSPTPDTGPMPNAELLRGLNALPNGVGHRKWKPGKTEVNGSATTRTVLLAGHPA